MAAIEHEPDFSDKVHRTPDELAAIVEELRQAPHDHGTLTMVVRRPQVETREMLDAAELSVEEGVVGDTWNQRGSKRTDDGGPHPDMALNLMGHRYLSYIARDDPDHMQWAGDQLIVDLDLSEANLPAGTRLAIGSAIIEITDQPHTGCAKFTRRFGLAAMRFANSELGTSLKLRGVNAKVVEPGAIAPGDSITKL